MTKPPPRSRGEGWVRGRIDLLPLLVDLLLQLVELGGGLRLAVRRLLLARLPCEVGRARRPARRHVGRELLGARLHAAEDPLDERLPEEREADDREEDQEKWPFIQDGFDFTLREADIATLNKNRLATIDHMEENAFRYDKLPDVFSRPGKLTDPNATTAKVAAILKRDLPNRAIIKFVAEQYSGTLWSIAKDDFGLPRYKYFNPHIWMAYKMDGKCYVGYVTLRQVYSGGGTYGPLEVAWTTTKDDRGIDCEKVK